MVRLKSSFIISMLWIVRFASVTTAEPFGIFLELVSDKGTDISITSSVPKEFKVKVKSNPPAISSTWSWNGIVLENSQTINITEDNDMRILGLLKPTAASTGVYSLEVDNDHMAKLISFKVRAKGPPIVRITMNDDGYKKGFFPIGKVLKITCIVTADPEDLTIRWVQKQCDTWPHCQYSAKNLTENYSLPQKDEKNPQITHTTLTMEARHTSILWCEACNNNTCIQDEYTVFATDVHEDERDLIIVGPYSEVVEGDDVTITCIASKYTYCSDFTWYNLDTGHSIDNDDSDRVYVCEDEEMKFSFVSKLTIYNVTSADDALYGCDTTYQQSLAVPATQTYQLEVLACCCDIELF